MSLFRKRALYFRWISRAQPCISLFWYIVLDRLPLQSLNANLIIPLQTSILCWVFLAKPHRVWKFWRVQEHSNIYHGSCRQIINISPANDIGMHFSRNAKSATFSTPFSCVYAFAFKFCKFFLQVMRHYNFSSIWSRYISQITLPLDLGRGPKICH